MKPLILAIFFTLFCCFAFSQKNNDVTKEALLKEISATACNCIDSISIYNKSKKEVSAEISKCIDGRTAAYQLAVGLLSADSLAKTSKSKNGKKEVNISVDLNPDSKQYKAYYYELERYMMANCEPLKEKIGSNNQQRDKSFSDNQESYQYYLKGLEEAKKENYDLASNYYLHAVQIDSQFAFAWDNLGIAYRKTGKLDSALWAYNQSLQIDPEGLTPLQNIAIVYQYKKEYQHAIEAYEKLATLDKNNPEVYYGIGQIYSFYMNENEKGLENMCHAYNLYVEQKSPYRTDAEKIIQTIYAAMKKDGKEDKFYEILKANNITPNKK
ncbi:MAG: tetratricopeptide repeat protein [Chitinophagaceae bacterium]